VLARTKETPAFWGRYLGKRDSHFQKDEITFLQRESPDTRLVFIYNDFFDFTEGSPQQPRKPTDAYTSGRTVALNAISAFCDATGLTTDQIPAGLWIYANVEPPPNFKVSAQWIRGWWEGMLEANAFDYGGIYGFTSAKQNTGYIADAYKAALNKMAAEGTLPHDFDPPLWAAVPQYGRKIPAQINFEYIKGLPPLNDEEVIWQYFGQGWKDDPSEAQGKFDMNLATQRGYDGMCTARDLVLTEIPEHRQEMPQPKKPGLEEDPDGPPPGLEASGVGESG
jgi:hypothetical protein